MDTMLKEAQGSHKSKKEKNKYWKRQSSKCMFFGFLRKNFEIF